MMAPWQRSKLPSIPKKITILSNDEAGILIQALRGPPACLSRQFLHNVADSAMWIAAQVDRRNAASPHDAAPPAARRFREHRLYAT
jgi:hypothetical protein